jgi:excisionase family DNA binding protein
MTRTATSIRLEDPVAENAQAESNVGKALRFVQASKLTVRQASEMAGIAESTMRVEIHKGRIPVIKIGSKMMIIESDPEDYLRGHYGFVPQTKAPLKFSNRLPKHIAESEFLNPRKKVA